MARAIRRGLIWPRSKKDKTVAETTSGRTESTLWVVVAANLNPGAAVVIKGRLESDNIPAIIQQEAVGSILGLTVGPLGSANVLAPEPFAGRARALLADTFDDEIGDE